MDDAKEQLEFKKQQAERLKVVIDYFKHLTTLSTWAILLIAAFVEKVFPAALWKPLTAISLISFLAAIIGGIMGFSCCITVFPPRSKKGLSGFDKFIGISGIILAWGGFIVGIASLAIFATKNLLK